MSNTVPLVKARLIELNPDFSDKKGGKETVVQFNPETLKVTYANQIVQPNNSGGGGASNSSKPSSIQFVGAGTTKLALQLWFDVSGQSADDKQAVADVRDLTKNVAYFITPKADGKAFVPPAVRFLWGSFSFEGIFDSLDETLEFFSDQGVPLRASMSISMSQQRIQAFSGNKAGLSPPSAAKKSGLKSGEAGTTPFTQAPTRSSLQSMAASSGQAGNWQAIAEANGLENPRQLSPGQLINLNPKTGS
jgi:hypothetical protein